MPDEMEEIISEFVTEAGESLDTIEPLFLELRQKGRDAGLLNNMLKSVHTIKGVAGFLGFQSLVDVVHATENILKKTGEGEITLSKPLMDSVLKSVDMLRLLLRHLREKDGIEEDTAPLLQELKNALKKAQSESIHTKETLIPEQTPKVTISPPGEVKQTPKITVSPPGQAKQTPGVTASPPKKAKQIYGKKEPAPEEAGPEPMDTARTPGIDTTVIDRVTDLACEMVMIRNRLLNLSEYFKQKYSDDCEGEALLETVSFLDRVTSDLQLAVMKMRMQPITPAVIQTLMVEVAGIKYAIPLSHIEEILRVSQQEISNIANQDVIVIRDNVCPLFVLKSILGLPPVENPDSENLYVAVVSVGDNKFCIAVDKLIGREEVVINALDDIDISSPYLLGATINGDGKVVFILDPVSMSRNLIDLTSV